MDKTNEACNHNNKDNIQYQGGNISLHIYIRCCFKNYNAEQIRRMLSQALVS